MRIPALRLVAAAIAAHTVAGCYGSATGTEGTLSFTYDTDDPTPNLGHPIAIGAQIDLRAEDPLTSTPLPIVEATVDDPGVVAVVAMDGGRATLRGIGEGSTTLRVTATLRGESVSDSLPISAAPVGRTQLASGCPDGADGVYLASSRLYVPFELERAPGQPLIGSGLYPFEIEPASALTLDASGDSMQYLVLRSGAMASRATIASTVDDARLVVDVVEETRIDGAKLRLGSSGDAIAVGATRFVLAQAEVDGRALCQGTPAFDATSATPSTCRVMPIHDLRDEAGARHSYGWIQVDGLAQGVCRIQVRYPNAQNGAGLMVPFTMNVR